jgi:hypothetical protein
MRLRSISAKIEVPMAIGRRLKNLLKPFSESLFGFFNKLNESISNLVLHTLYFVLRTCTSHLATNRTSA